MQTALRVLSLTVAIVGSAAPVQFGFVLDSTQYIHSVASPKPTERVASIGGSVVLDPASARWLIRFPALGNSEEIHYCDGTNVVEYTLVRHVDPTLIVRLDGASLAALPKDGGPIGMVVSPGLHPVDHYAVNLVWLAWCSGPYLKTPGRTVPSPVNVIRSDLTAFGFLDRTETFPDGFGLPKRLELFASHEKLKFSPVAPTIGREIPSPERMEAAFARKIMIKDGAMHVRYTAESSATLGDIALPTRFNFESFELRTDDQEVLTVAAQGRMLGEPLPGKFDLPAAIGSHRNFGVVDHRFRHPSKAVDFIQYGQEEPVVRSATDPKLVGMYERKLALASLDPVLQVKRRFYGMMGLGLILPVTAAVFWWRKRKATGSHLNIQHFGMNAGA